jgi:hypothetical protein
VLICNIFNGLAAGKSETRRLIDHQQIVTESKGRGIRMTAIEELKNYDPVLGLGWIHTTTFIEAPDGRHVFRDKERYRLFTYSDITNFTSQAGFKETSHYAGWNPNLVRNPNGDVVVFVARKA